MTKCIVLGEQPEERPIKPIEFKYFLTEIGGLSEPAKPSMWENIELVSKRKDGLDVMFAYDGNRSTGAIMLGYWNDGVV